MATLEMDAGLSNHAHFSILFESSGPLGEVSFGRIDH
jgi:hypothetical protein